MKNRQRIASVLFLSAVFVGLFGCTMELDQPASATPFSEALSPSPISTDAIVPSSSQTIAVPWANLHLSGRLIYSTAAQEGGLFTSSIRMLDLSTGERKIIYSIYGNAWIYYLAVSPDATQIVMAYTPPSQPGSDSGTSVYQLPLEEGAAPQILFTPPTLADRYIQVEWSPDGQYLYFVHYNHTTQPSDQPFPDYDVSRMAHPGGLPEKILEHAFWPRLAPDSAKLVYVTLDPVAGTNELFLANADGSNPQRIELSGGPAIIDAPIFSPDGASILFSAPSPSQAYQPNWLDRLMGVRIARAHNVPSDWWSVPLSGGTATRLTHIQDIKLFASISPDGKHIASLSGAGIFVMDTDGSNLTQLLFDPGVNGTVRWIP
jgi:Tol biopolymer transport system component